MVVVMCVLFTNMMIIVVVPEMWLMLLMVRMLLILRMVMLLEMLICVPIGMFGERVMFLMTNMLIWVSLKGMINGENSGCL